MSAGLFAGEGISNGNFHLFVQSTGNISQLCVGVTKGIICFGSCVDRAPGAVKGVIVFATTDISTETDKDSDDGTLLGSENRDSVFGSLLIGVIFGGRLHAGNAYALIIHNIQQWTELMC